MNKTLAIAAVLMASALTAIISTTNPIVFAQDESESNTEQEIKQKNVCSGWAVCTNIAENRENTATGANTP